MPRRVVEEDEVRKTSNAMRPDSQAESIRPVKKHDSIRKNKVESEKLSRIEHELRGSFDL